jgi:hypothetical protein
MGTRAHLVRYGRRCYEHVAGSPGSPGPREAGLPVRLGVRLPEP